MAEGFDFSQEAQSERLRKAGINAEAELLLRGLVRGEMAQLQGDVEFVRKNTLINQQEMASMRSELATHNGKLNGFLGDSANPGAFTIAMEALQKGLVQLGDVQHRQGKPLQRVVAYLDRIEGIEEGKNEISKSTELLEKVEDRKQTRLAIWIKVILTAGASAVGYLVHGDHGASHK